MVTEAMGGLILAGALLVLFVRWLADRQRPAAGQGDMQAATMRLKQELERSGNEIVARIGTHVERLEGIVREAEGKAQELRGQMAQLQQLQLAVRQQMEQQRLMAQQLEGQRQQLLLQQQRNQAALDAMRSAPPAAQGQRPMEEMPERVDARDFAAVLQQSIARDEQAARQQQAARQAAERAREAAPPPPEEPREEPPPETEPEPSEEDRARAANSAKARSLLISGWSVEDVAKETGLGKGAVELIRQMSKKQMA